MESQLGKWVSDKDMHPMQNIYGRMWMTDDGKSHGTYYPGSPLPRGPFSWFFPTAPKIESDTGKVDDVPFLNPVVHLWRLLTGR